MTTSLMRGVVATASLAAALSAAANPLPAGALRVQRVDIIDRKGFDKPLVAATIMVPAGWQHQHSVDWTIGRRCGSPIGLRMSATAPDGSAAIELIPGLAWANTNFGGPMGDCPRAAYRDAREYLGAWVQQHRAGARWLDYRQRPDKARAAQEQTWQGGLLRQWTDSGQALIGYTHNGREVREVLAARVSFTFTRMAGLQGTTMQTQQGQSLGVLGWRAPNGAIDFRQFDAVWDSIQSGAEWRARVDAGMNQMAAENAATQAKIGQIQAETSRQTLAEIAKRGQMAHQTRQEIADMQAGNYRARSESNDTMHRETVRTIREVNAYREPRTGGVVELSSHYRHAWQLKDGSYLLTDNPNFDPARDIGIAGEQLTRTR